MHILSLDIETLGLTIDCSVLQVGIVGYDTKTDKILFGKEWDIKNPAIYCNDYFALNMNMKLLQKITSSPDKCTLSDAALDLESEYLSKDQYKGIKWVLAGKNIGGFDSQFLSKEPLWASLFKRYCSYRYLDIGSLFADHTATDLPNMKKCCEIAGVSYEERHEALYDARLNIECIRYAIKSGRF